MKHKTEINHSFELKEDSETRRFHKWAIFITLILGYCIACSGACGFVIFANWAAK